MSLYPYNDLLIRTKPPAGHAFAVDAINGEPTCLCYTPLPCHTSSPCYIPLPATSPHHATSLTMLHPLTMPPALAGEPTHLRLDLCYIPLPDPLTTPYHPLPPLTIPLPSPYRPLTVPSGEPTYLQIDGKPTVAALTGGGHRLWAYGGSTWWGHTILQP